MLKWGCQHTECMIRENGIDWFKMISVREALHSHDVVSHRVILRRTMARCEDFVTNQSNQWYQMAARFARVLKDGVTCVTITLDPLGGESIFSNFEIMYGVDVAA